MQSQPVAGAQKPFLDRNFTFFLTHIQSEGKLLKFFALPENRSLEYQQLETLLARKSQELENSPPYEFRYQNSVGSVCCVKSSMKAGLWCRAKVLELNDNLQRALVMLLDYGNTEIIPVYNIRCTDPSIISIPTYIIECILADVVPSLGDEWTVDAVRMCEEKLYMQKLSGYIVSMFFNTAVVRIAKLGESEPFVQRLINEGHAKIEAIEACTFRVQPLTVKTTHLISISHVHSPQLFYLQLSAAELELNNLMESVRNFTDQQKLCAPSSATVGLPCLAWHNGHHFRASILAIQQNVCRVMFVDYGNILNKDFQDLRAIPSHFLALPAQAIACTLKEEHSITAEEFLALTTSAKYFTCQILGTQNEKYVVSLFIENRNIITLTKTKQPSRFPVQPLTLENKLEVTGSYVNSPWDFYCQISSCKKDLDIITLKLESANDFELLQISDISSGSLVCAKYSEDNFWYRARVLVVHDTSSIDVSFVDYGNTDKVKIGDIRMIPSNLMMHSIHAYKFSLHGLNETTLDTSTDKWFEVIALEHALRAEIKSCISESEYSVILYVVDQTESVNEQLQQRLCPSIMSPPNVSSTENLYVTYFGSPSSFFGQLMKFDQAALLEQQAKLNTYCQSVKSNSCNIKIGDSAGARFCEDNQFYRAVVESVSGNEANVVFVDYGNRSSVKMQDLQKLSADFVSHPYFGIECVLKNCQGAESLSSLLLDQEIQVNLLKQISPGKYEVSFTESFPGNLNVLKFLCQSSNTREKNVPVEAAVIRNLPDNLLHNGNPSFAEQRPSAIAEKVEVLSDYTAEFVIPNGSFKEIYVTCVKSLNEFYCQLISETDQLQKLMKQLEATYGKAKGNDMQLREIRVDAPCCTFSEEDSRWCRAKIKSTSGNQCQVFFVDYGGREVVPTNRVKILLREFFSLSPQALKCSLFNIVSERGGWSDSDIKAFKKMASKKSFVAQFVETESAGTHMVNLFDINKLQDDVLSKDLVKLGHGHLKDSSKVLVVNSLVASTSLTYPKRDVSFTTEVVSVTFVIDALNFFCQKYDSAEFKEMMSKIQRHYESQPDNEGVVDQPHAGMICVSQFSQDQVWYRATISKVDKSTVTVYYVDYGNAEVVKKHNVKYILQDFAVLPSEAIRCRLKDLSKPSESLPSSFPDLFEGKCTCTFVSKEKDIHMVDLVRNADGKNIAQEIASMGLAVYAQAREAPKRSVEALKAPQIISTHTATFQKHQLISVSVSHVDSPSKFWCQLEDSISELQEMVDNIQEYCASGNALPAQPAKGTYCLAKFTVDEFWYRAKIEKVDSTKLEVIFVDYGNSDVIDANQIRELPDDLLRLPAQGLLCRLHGCPEGCNEIQIGKFKVVTENASELMAKIESVNSDCLSISLYDQSDSENEVNVFDLLGVEQVIERGGGDVTSAFVLPILPSGQEPGHVEQGGDPGQFSVHLVSQDANLDEVAMQLSEALVSELKALPSSDVVPGVPCCAKYSEDGEWYRAQVMDIQGESATVFFIDYGNTDVVPKAEMKILNEDALKIPPCAIQCSLAGVHAANGIWEKEVLDKFNDFIQDAELNITFTAQSIPAPVYIEKDGIKLNDILMAILTPKADSAQKLERVLPISKLTARICFVESHQSLFITATEWTDELNTLMDSLAQTYESEESNTLLLESVEIGEFCAAKFEEDGTWYRAVVTAQNEDGVVIEFIDYGNTETVQLQELRSLKSELRTHPPFAVKCYLSSLKAIVGKESEIIEKLNAMVEEIMEFNVECETKPYRVQLSTSNGDFVSSLVDEGLALSPTVAEEETTTSAEEETATELLSEKSTAEQSSTKRKITQSELAARIVFFETCEKIFLRAAEWRDDFNCVANALDEIYNDPTRESSLQLEKIEIGQLFAAKSNDDNKWYRAQVIELDGEEITVKFIDYSNEETIRLDNIRELESSLAEHPPFAVECILDIEVIKGKEDDMIAKLDTFCSDEVDLTFYVVSNDEPYRVKLITIDDDFASLVEAELAITEPPVEAKKMWVSGLASEELNTSSGLSKRKIGHSHISARIAFAECCNKIYITAAEWLDDLDNLASTLGEIYNDPVQESSLCLQKIEIGQLCAAKFIDTLWYRAQVVSCDGGNVTIKFVDYGNTETTPVSDIRALDSRLVAHLPFAVECILDFELIEEKDREIFTKLDTFCSDAIEMDFHILSDEEPYHVTLLTPDGDFVSLLVREGLAEISKLDEENSNLLLQDENLDLQATDVKTDSVLERPDNDTALDEEEYHATSELNIIAKEKEKDIDGESEQHASIEEITMDATTDVLKSNEESENLVFEGDTLQLQTEEETDSVLERPNNDTSLDEGEHYATLQDTTARQNIMFEEKEQDIVSKSEPYALMEENMSDVINEISKSDEETPNVLSDDEHLRLERGVRTDLVLDRPDDDTTLDEGEHYATLQEDTMPKQNIMFEEEEQDIVSKSEPYVLMEENMSDAINEISKSDEETPNVLSDDEHLHLERGVRTDLALDRPDNDTTLNEGEHYATLQDAMPKQNIMFEEEEQDIVSKSEPYALMEENMSDAINEISKSDEEMPNVPSDDEHLHLQTEVRTDLVLGRPDNDTTLVEDYCTTLQDSSELNAVYEEKKQDFVDKSEPLTALQQESASDAIVNTMELTVAEVEQKQDLCESEPDDIKLSTMKFTCIGEGEPILDSGEDNDFAPEIQNNKVTLDTEGDFADEGRLDIMDEIHEENDAMIQHYPCKEDVSGNICVTMSHVESWNEFYVTPRDSTSVYEHVKDLLKSEYGNRSVEPIEVPSLVVGQPCVAKFSEDQSWYRAVVKDIDSDNIFVTFVDHGNSELVPIKDIKGLKHQLLTIPPCALKCYLFDIHPEHGIEDDIVAQLQLLMDEIEGFEIEIMSGGDIFGVRLNVSGDDTNLLVTESPGEADLDDKACNTFKDDTLFTSGLRMGIFETGAVESKVSFVESWDKFYISAVAWEKEFNSLKLKLASIYAESSDFAEVISSGEACIWYSSDKEEWCRCIVLDIIGGTASLHLIDYGEILETEIKSLRNVDDAVPNAPCFAIECKLFGLIPIQAKEFDIVEKLEDLCDAAIKINISVMSYDHPYSVKMDVDGDFLSQLIQQGLAVSDSSPERLHDSETFKDNLKIAFVDELVESSKSVIPMHTISEGKITGTLQQCEVSEGKIHLYITSSGLDASLEEFHRSLQMEYSEMPSSSFPLNEGDYYVAKFPQDDDSWYRIQLLKKDEDSILAEAIDQGITEHVKMDDVRELSSKFSEVPPYIFNCCIVGLDVDGTNARKVEQILMGFQDEWTITKCRIPEHFVGNQHCGTKPIVSDCDIVKYLVSKSLARQVFPIVYDLDVFQCNVVDVDENLNIFVIPLAYIEKRNKVQEELKILYDSMHNEETEVISLSRLYAVQKDSVWYRATVCSINADDATVFCVDFGVTYSVKTTSMFALHTDFCHLSPFCISTEFVGLSNTGPEMQHRLLNTLIGQTITCVTQTESKCDLSTPLKVYMSIDGKEVLELMNEADAILLKTKIDVTANISALPDTGSEGDSIENSSQVRPELVSQLPDDDEEAKESFADEERFDSANVHEALIGSVEVPSTSVEKSVSPTQPIKSAAEENVEEYFTEVEDLAKSNPDLKSSSPITRTLPIGRVDVSVLGFEIRNDAIHIAVMENDLKSEFNQLQCDMQEYYTNRSALKTKIEGPCAVLSPEGSWNRGTVIAVDDSTATVSSWDCHCETKVPIDQVYELDQEFSSQPPYLVWCMLPAIKCTESDTMLNKMTEGLVGQEFTVGVLEEKQPYPIVLSDNSVIQNLLEEYKLMLTLLPSSICSGQHSCVISHIEEESLLIFHLQLRSQLEDLDSLRTAMNIYYADINSNVPLEKAVDAAMYGVKIGNTYERCTISKQNDGTFIHLIDVGMYKEAGESAIQHLPYEFALKPQFALPVVVSSLSNISEERITDIPGVLKKASDDGLLVVTLLERDNKGIYSANLTVEGQDVSICLENELSVGEKSTSNYEATDIDTCAHASNLTSSSTLDADSEH